MEVEKVVEVVAIVGSLISSLKSLFGKKKAKRGGG